MTTIVAFLTARLDEDQAAALATTPVPMPGRWKAARDKHAPGNAPLFLIQGEDEHEPGSEDYSGNSPVIAYSAEWQDKAEADLRYIARHDPARALREVEAKRAIVAQHEGVHACPSPRPWSLDGNTDYVTEEECWTLRNLASVYADHPDYEQALAL